MTHETPAASKSARLAIAAMNRGEALARDPARHAQTAARAAYGEAIERLRALEFSSDARLANSLGAALLNRGQLAHLLDGPETARDDMEAAIQILDTLVPGADPWPRRNLCGALANLANLLLDLGEPEQAQVHAARALALARPHERASEVDTLAALLARRSLCDAIGQRIHRADSDAETLATQAGDLADEALALIRLHRRGGAEPFAELSHRFYRFGSQLFATYQPQFLLEFLQDHLATAVAARDSLAAIAQEAIAVAFDALSNRVRELADDPQTLDRCLRLLAELGDAHQRVDIRLSEAS